MRRPLLVGVLIAMLGPGAASATAAPLNDDFAAAAPLTVGPFSGTTEGATGQAGEQTVEGEGFPDSCFAPASCQKSVWYAITPAADGPVTVSVCGAAVEVFTGASLSTMGGAAIGRPRACPTPVDVAFDGFAGVRAIVGLAAPRGVGQPFSGQVTAAPETSIFTGFTTTRSPVVASLRSANAGATFECGVDGAAFAPCTTPLSLAGLSQGDHVLRARAVDHGAVDPSPATASFTVDDVAPPTTIQSSVPADGGVTNSPSARVTVASSPDAFGVTCVVDGVDLGFCGSVGTEFVVTGFCSAPHTIRVAALDRAGNVGGPQTLSFTTTGRPACAAPSLGSPTATPGWKQARVSVPITPGGSGTDVRLDLSGPTTGTFHAPPSAALDVGSQGAASFTLPDLRPGAAYTYSVVATNTTGTATTSGTFTTASAPAGSATEAVTDVTDHEATLSGTFDPGNASPGAFGTDVFAYGRTTAYGRFEPLLYPFAFQTPSPVSFSYRLGGLASGTLHHAQLQTTRPGPATEIQAVDLPDVPFTTLGPAPAGGTPPGGTPPGGTPPGGTPPGSVPPPGTTPAGPVAVILKAKSPAITGTGTKLSLATGTQVACGAASGTCAVAATATAPSPSPAKSARAKTYIAGKATLTIAPGKRKSLVLKLGRTAVRALRAHKTLKVTLTVVVRAGKAKPVVSTRKLSVPLPKKATAKHR